MIVPMAKFKFDSLKEFSDYVERYFSQNRGRNYGNDNFEFKECKRRGDVAYMTFDVNEDFDSVAACIKIPAKNVWLCFFPKFSHDGLKDLPSALGEINDQNHKARPDRHPPSEEKLNELPDNYKEWQTIDVYAE